MVRAVRGPGVTEAQGAEVLALLEVIEQGVRVLVFVGALCAAALFGQVFHRWTRGS